MYNILLYIGVGLMLFIFLMIIANEMYERNQDIEAFKQKQLTNSFNNNKLIK